MDIKDIFSAAPKSIWHLLCENGLGFYIPAYQREYSWDKEKLYRLFEDTAHGLTLLIDSDDAITFIGTIITIHDTKYQTVSPQVTEELPSKVMIVIDGQQRITTSLIVNTILHEEIKLRSTQLKKDLRSNEAYQSLLQLSLKTIHQLEQTFEEKKPYGDDDFIRYPRIIRAYDDSWSPYETTAQYTSPIAKYIHNYSKHTSVDNVQSKFKHTVDDIGEDKRKKHQILITNVRTVRKLINTSVAKTKGTKDIEMPSLKDLANSTNLQETLFGSVLKRDVITILLNETPDTKQIKFQELTRLLFFSKFILERMAVTVVTAKNEDYAFDMFEALNTTGEPLTAFETFKPRVINAEGLSNYKNSDTRRFIKRIESYLDVFSDAQQKQNATTAFLVPFALSETGKKLSKRLSDQRRYLRDSFEKLEKKEQQEFVRRLSHTSGFIKDIWPKNKSAESKLIGISHSEQDTALMCINVLRQANHHITIAPLSCFYSLIQTSQGEQRDKAIDDFISAIKAITAFFVFWRSSRQGTKGIDAHYRDLMKSGVKKYNIPPLAKNASSNVPASRMTASQLQQSLVYILEEEGGIKTKADWLRLLSETPIYSNSTPLAVFMLLVASHNTRAAKQESNYGLVEFARNDFLDMLSLKQWQKAKAMTIEHIAPQSQESSWPTELYDNSNFIHILGNLALLPQIENASIGNKSWQEKRTFFKILSAETNDDLQTLLEESQQNETIFQKNTEQILKTSKYLPHVKAISNVDRWDADIVLKRTKNLGELIWRQLAPWLGIKTSD